MADIFISYSSYNRDKALALARELRSAGFDIWTDQGGIGGAQDWSSEIVSALNNVKTVIFLISKDSVTSHNCAKEIHLASEKHKNILPVIIEETPLPVLFEYPLAGLQRVPYEHTSAIIQALEVLKGGKSVLEAMLAQSKIDDGLTRLAILPFHDLSPAKDNDWFADGMMDELISTLGSLGHLKVPPRSDVMYYKQSRPKAQEMATDLHVRYLVEGSVMKSGEKIRINVTLIDTVKNEQVWNERYSGTFDDIFDFQEQTAKAIAEALRIILTPEEAKKLEKKETENAEAYELYLKGREYFLRHSRADFAHAITLYEDAIKLDDQFVEAYQRLGITSIEYYIHFSHEQKWVTATEEAIRKIEEIEDGQTKGSCRLRSILAHHTGNYDEALRYAQRAIEIDPNYASGYDALGWAYQALGRFAECVEAREHDLRLREHDLLAHHSLLIALNELGNPEKIKAGGRAALPIFERHLRFVRDDDNTRAKYIYALGMAGERARSLTEAAHLIEHGKLDDVGLYNMACFYAKENVPDKAFHVLRRSIRQGFLDRVCMTNDPDLDSLRDKPEFTELMKEVEARIAQDDHG